MKRVPRARVELVSNDQTAGTSGQIQGTMSRAVIRLLSSITDLYRDTVAAKGAGFVMLADALQAIAASPYPKDALRASAPANRTVKPVTSLVANLDASGPHQKIIELFCAAEPFLDWHQEAVLAAKRGAPDAIAQAFLEGHGYVEIVGPGRLFRSANTRVGLLLMAPSTLYPDHAHPADEVYHVVSGTAEWWQQGDGWIEKPPGTIVHHASGLPHATRTRSELLLAIYCWRGPVEVAEDENAAPKPDRSKGRKTARKST